MNTDLGVSNGMQAGIDHAANLQHDLEFRSVPGWISTGER